MKVSVIESNGGWQLACTRESGVVVLPVLYSSLREAEDKRKAIAKTQAS